MTNKEIKLTHKQIKIFSAISAIVFFMLAPVIWYAGSISGQIDKTPNDHKDDAKEITRNDEGAARDVAWKVLSSAFITLSEGKVVGDKIMFDALVGGQKCSIVMSISQSVPPRWVADEINCKK